MATTNMSYDHPQYTVNQVGGGFLRTLTTDTQRVSLTAFANLVVRAVHVNPIVTGTSTAAANIGHFLSVVSGTGGGITTATLIAAGAFGTGLVGTAVSVTSTLTRGQSYTVINTGTDAGAQYGVGIEFRVVPGASVES